ncbi:MAG: N-acetylmuramoyl-L-alanine amidase [Cyanobacteria bacterium P01_G01_bin.39]
MRFHWLLSGFIGVFLLCSPAEAGKIVSWEFEPQDNSLVFKTDQGVQPEAELLSNPTRLVIDLPGTSLDRETVKESYPGVVRGFRIGQPEPDTSRIVVELAPGYTLDADDIEFDSISTNHWSVELPRPQPSRFASSGDSETLDLPQVELPSSTLPGLEATTANAPGVIDSPYIKATRNGFYVDIDGNRKIKIDSERDGDRIDFVLEGITIPEELVSQSVAVNQYGVSSIEFEQSDDQVTMSLAVTPGSPDWLATFSRIKGLLLVPRGKLPTSNVAAVDTPETQSTLTIDEPEEQEPLEDNSQQLSLSQIDEIELADNDAEFLVHGDNQLSAVASRTSNGIYQITIDNAELAEDFKGPELKAGSPISELKVRQDDSRVALEITTRLGYRLGKLDADNEQIVLPIETGVAPLPPSDAPLMPPGFAKAPKERALTPITPVPASDRPRVIIDPGHGGKDPGTVGIAGFQEKDVVLPISMDVAEILRKQNIEVIMTRETDNFISLEGRTNLANDVDADLFVSIHANAINLSRPDVNGLETYYYKSGRRLAEVIHWSILNGVNIDNRGIRRARFYVLRHSTMPAVLVEVGFLTGAVDSSRLKDPNHRRQMAEAIARGIIQYIKQNNP